MQRQQQILILKRTGYSEPKTKTKTKTKKRSMLIFFGSLGIGEPEHLRMR